MVITLYSYLVHLLFVECGGNLGITLLTQTPLGRFAAARGVSAARHNRRNWEIRGEGNVVLMLLMIMMMMVVMMIVQRMMMAAAAVGDIRCCCGDLLLQLRFKILRLWWRRRRRLRLLGLRVGRLIAQKHFRACFVRILVQYGIFVTLQYWILIILVLLSGWLKN